MIFLQTWFENRKLALVFEAKVGNGKLVVCSIDLKTKIDERPVSKQLLLSLLDYMNSNSFNPDCELPITQVRSLINN